MPKKNPSNSSDSQQTQIEFLVEKISKYFSMDENKPIESGQTEKGTPAFRFYIEAQSENVETKVEDLKEELKKHDLQPFLVEEKGEKIIEIDKSGIPQEEKERVDKPIHCTQCGDEVDDDAIYCESCGHKIGKKKKGEVKEEHERKKDYQPTRIQRKESSDGFGKKGLVIGVVAIIIIGIVVVIVLNVRSGKEVKVIYEGSWSGAIVDSDGIRSISGSGTETFSVSGTVSANAQKMDGSSREITIQIIRYGNVVEEQSTTSAYGIVSVTG